MVWKFCEIWKTYGKQGPEGPKFCEILSHSVIYGMYAFRVISLDSSWKADLASASYLINNFRNLSYFA